MIGADISIILPELILAIAAMALLMLGVGFIGFRRIV